MERYLPTLFDFSPLEDSVYHASKVELSVKRRMRLIDGIGTDMAHWEVIQLDDQIGEEMQLTAPRRARRSAGFGWFGQGNGPIVAAYRS